MNCSYTLNSLCPKFVSNKSVFRKIEVRVIEVLLYRIMWQEHVYQTPSFITNQFFTNNKEKGRIETNITYKRAMSLNLSGLIRTPTI